MATIAAGALVLVSVLTAAHAYVLQGPHVLDLMVGHMGKMRSLRVSQEVTLYDERLPEGRTVLAEIACYRLPDAFRADTTGDGLHRIYLHSDRSAVTVMDGHRVQPADTVFDRYKDLLLYRDRKVLEKQLARLGVDITVSSLGRFEDHIAFVLGARYPDDSKSQVWIDKETFRPLRWLVRDSGETVTELEIQYRQWAKSGPVHYPMRILFFQSGELVREIAAGNLEVNPSLAEDLFDPGVVEAAALAMEEKESSPYQEVSGADTDSIGGRPDTLPTTPSTAN